MHSHIPTPETIDDQLPFYLEIVQETTVSLYILTSMVALTCNAPPDDESTLTMRYPGSEEPLIIYKGEYANRIYEWVLRAKILEKQHISVNLRCGTVGFWTRRQIFMSKGILD